MNKLFLTLFIIAYISSSAYAIGNVKRAHDISEAQEEVGQLVEKGEYQKAIRTLKASIKNKAAEQAKIEIIILADLYNRLIMLRNAEEYYRMYLDIRSINKK